MKTLKELKETNFLHLSDEEKETLIYNRLCEDNIKNLTKKEIIEVLMLNGYLVKYLIQNGIEIDVDMSLAACSKYGDVLYSLPFKFIFNRSVIRKARKASEKPVDITIKYILLLLISWVVYGVRSIYRLFSSLLDEPKTLKEKEEIIIERLKWI